MTLSKPHPSLASLLCRRENLYAAWLKYRHYVDTVHDWVDEVEIARFEANLGEELAGIAKGLANLDYRMTPLRPLPFPLAFHGEGALQAGSGFHFAVRDQVAWIAFLNVVGPDLDWQMPAASYGGRLVRSASRRNERGVEVAAARYPLTGCTLYRNPEESWTLYRRHLFLTAQAMAKTLDPEDLNAADLEVLQREQRLSGRLRLPFLTDGFFDAKGNENRGKNGDREVYLSHLTFDTCNSGFNISCALSNLSAFSNPFKEEVWKLSSSLLDFRLDPAHWNGEELSALGLSSADEPLKVLPGGLAVGAFLKNVALMEVERCKPDGQAVDGQAVDGKGLGSGAGGAMESGTAHFRFGDDLFFMGNDFEALTVAIAAYQDRLAACGCGICLDFKKDAPDGMGAWLAAKRKGGQTKDLLEKMRDNARDNALVDSIYPLPVMTRTLRQLSDLAALDFDFLQQGERSHHIDQMENFLLDENPAAGISAEFQMDMVARKLAWTAPQEILGNQANLCPVERQLFEERSQVSAIEKRIGTLRETSEESLSARAQLVRSQERIDELLARQEKTEASNTRRRRRVNDRVFSMLLKALRDHPERLNLWVYQLQYCQFVGNDDLSAIHTELIRLCRRDPERAGYMRALVFRVMANQVILCAVNMSHKEHLIYRRKAAYTFLKGLFYQSPELLYGPEDGQEPAFYEVRARRLLECALGSVLVYLAEGDNELVTEGDLLTLRKLADRHGAMDWNKDPEKWAKRSGAPLCAWAWWAESFLNPSLSAKSGVIWKRAAGKLKGDDPGDWPLLSLYPSELAGRIGLTKAIRLSRRNGVFDGRDCGGWLHELIKGAGVETYKAAQEATTSPMENDLLGLLGGAKETWITLDDWVDWSRAQYRERPYDPRFTEWTSLELLDQIIGCIKENCPDKDSGDYPLHPLTVALPAIWTRTKETLLTWSDWRKIVRDPRSRLEIREAGWIHDNRYVENADGPEGVDGQNGMIRGLGLLLLGLVSRSFDWPAIWHVRGHEDRFLPLVRARMREVPFSSWTHSLLTSCFRPRGMETVLSEGDVRQKSGGRGALNTRAGLSLDRFHLQVKEARALLTGYQMTLQQHVTRQLIPVNLSHFTRTEADDGASDGASGGASGGSGELRASLAGLPAAGAGGLEDFLRVGLIQTTTNAQIAWQGFPKMTAAESDHAWREIRHGFHILSEMEEKPHFIILPELAVPVCFRTRLLSLARKIGAIVIAGMDYTLDHPAKTARNQALVIVPGNWPQMRPSAKSSTFYFGKTYIAPGEGAGIRDSGFEFEPDRTIWLFDSGKFGRIGVCICYDFMDVERYRVYRGRIHHLFVIAYNRDIDSFSHLAESLSKTIFCNVVICNTGFYGGSLAVTPYYEPFRRTLYRHEGKNLFAVQVAKLPIEGLDAAQQGRAAFHTGPDGHRRRVFKNLPPGYDSR